MRKPIIYLKQPKRLILERRITDKSEYSVRNNLNICLRRTVEESFV